MQQRNASQTAGVFAALVAGLLFVPAAGAKVRAATVASYVGGAQLTARGDDYAVTDRDKRGNLQVLVGHGKAAPVVAEGIGAGFQGPVHFGTDASGATVLTYPRCDDGQRARCDLYSWDLATQKESPIEGVNGAATAEVEGVMDRGAVAFTRGTGLHPSLLFKPAGGRPRTLSKSGGQQLALGSRGVLQVIRDVDTDIAKRKPTLLQQITLNGKTKTLRRQAANDLQQLETPTYLGGRIYYTLTTRTATTLLRITATGRTQRAHTGKTEQDLTFTSPTRAYSLRPDYTADADNPTIKLVQLTGIAFT